MSATAAPRPGAPVVLEREAELAELAALAAQAARREGAVVLLEGPAGIGKTAMLAAAREAARAEGLVVLSAVASPLDRDFPFGLVHQLLGPVIAGADEARRARLFTGAAGLAEAVLAPAAPQDASQDPTHAVLHGLYWLVANLAEEAPLALVVDDLHWADIGSLRLLEFLGRRLEGLPLLVVGGVRPDEDGAELELLGALAAGPAARTTRLAPLSREATGEALARALGHAPEPAFTEACHTATGGTPLLVQAVAREAAERGLTGRAGEAEDAVSLAVAGVAGATERRVRGLGAEAEAVARAVTVLGDAARADDLAALTGLGVPHVMGATDRLVRAGVLDGETQGFVHPLVGEALAAALAPGERSALHERAARRLADRGASPGQVAGHLLRVAPAGEAWVVDVLRAAAAAAAASGTPETAAAHLARALAEPPAPEERAAILLGLGELEIARGRGGEGLDRLAEALAAGPAPGIAVRARVARADALLLRDGAAAMAELRAARAAAGDAPLPPRLESLGLEATFYDGRLAGERAGFVDGAADPPSAAVLAHRAIDAAYAAEPAARVVAPAQAALADGALVREVGPASATVNLLALALRHAEEPGLAAALLDGAEVFARERGIHRARFFLGHARAYWHQAYGTSTAAEAHAREALAMVAGSAAAIARASAAAILAEVLVERNALDEAEALLAEHPLPPGGEAGVGAPDALSARARVHRSRGRDAEAVADLRAAQALLRERGWRVPLKGRVTLRLAEALAATGAHEEAVALLAEEEAAVRARGAAGTTGIVLRARARVERDRAAELLEEAEALLRPSAMRHDLAAVLLDRGTALRRAGRPADAREPLREALDLASRLGATRLARLAQEELVQSGARPRRSALSGAEALTPSERRVADLAAAGRTNREIAETLWVTRKTVELHLGRAYAKLGIRSRTQLADALSA